jgi:type IV fimbrial biogenesis protein FimT
MESHRSAGFTLLELLIALMIMGILAFLAAPAWRGLMTEIRVGNWQRQLHGALYYTRGHAIYSGKPTVICARGSSGGCAASGGSWHNGWLVFEDPQGAGDCRPGPEGRVCSGTGAPVLRMREGTDDLRIINNHNVARRVRYNPQGLSYGYTGRFTVCAGTESAEDKGLVIANTGRIRSARPSELLSCPDS